MLVIKVWGSWGKGYTIRKNRTLVQQFYCILANITARTCRCEIYNFSNQDKKKRFSLPITDYWRSLIGCKAKVVRVL